MGRGIGEKAKDGIMMRQAAFDEAVRPGLPRFRAGVFFEEEEKKITLPFRPRTEEEEWILTEQAIQAMRACQLEAERNGINDLTEEEFEQLVYGE